MRERCTNAAFVTADLDLERGRATRIGGGRLLPGARHDMFGLLVYHPASHRLTAILRMPDGRLLNEELRVPERQWHLYDFDLASLTVTAQYRRDRRAGFGFGLPLILVGEGPGPSLRHLGRAELRFVRQETLGGRRALRFEAGGPAFGGRGGPIWFDSDEGHILAAQWGIPNHSEYRDFALRLTGVNDGGAGEWRRLLAAHFEGCPRS